MAEKMSKAEVAEKIADIYGDLDNLSADVRSAMKDFGEQLFNIMAKIEEMPDNADDIVDEVKD